jgi:hypothetical protein
MRSKIFKRVLLVVLGTMPGVILAQHVSKSVMAKYLVVVNTDNGSAMQPAQVIRTSVAYKTFVDTSEKTAQALKAGYTNPDTGNNNIYIFTKPQVPEVIEFDPEVPVVYLNNKQLSNEDSAIELIKNYSKTYTVNAKDKLVIDNLYGKISVNTWNRNDIRVDIQVKVAARDEADAKQLLNKVSINNKKIGSKVSFKTNIAKESVWNLISGNNKNIYRRIEINYNIYMPTRNALDISNQWGIIELPDFEGKVVINCSYTNLIAQSLSNTAEIHINNGDAKIAKLKKSDLNISYGNLSLGSADKLTAVVNFSSAKIGKINTSGVINMQYGTGLQIDDLDKNMKNLSVNSSFSNVKLGLSDTKNANFNVTVRNGSFSYNNPAINMATKNPSDSTANSGQMRPAQNYRGQVGKGSTTKIIKINSSYGSVKFN